MVVKLWLQAFREKQTGGLLVQKIEVSRKHIIKTVGHVNCQSQQQQFYRLAEHRHLWVGQTALELILMSQIL